MITVRKSWIAAVTGALLVGTLVGVVWARPHDRPQAQDITRKVTLAGADFIPADPDDRWGNNGNYAFSESGISHFTAPVVFPCLPSVTVERIKLYVYDGNGTYNACASLNRLSPRTGANPMLGSVCSPYGGSTSDPQAFTSTNINQVVWPGQRAYIWLAINGVDIDVYAVTIEYHRNI